jgi:hypothetical protein
MHPKRNLKELWEPEQGLEDPVLQHALFYLHGDIEVPLSNCDGDRFLDLCKKLNIQPIVYEKLKAGSKGSFVNEPWFTHLRLESLKIAGACAYRQQTLARVVGSMQQAGMKPILLKGPALGNTVYPRVHWRTSHDIDLLIDPEDWDSANECLTQLGYQSAPCLNWGYLSFEKCYSASENYPESPLIELHLRLNNRPLLCVFSYQELLEKAVKISIENEAVWIPDKVDHFIYLCVHRAGHFPQDRRFAWLLDLFYLGQSFSANDWQKVVELAIDKEVATILKVCLEDVNRVLKFGAPEKVMFDLQKQVASGRETSAGYLEQRYSKAHDLVNRWLEIPTAKAKFSYLWRWIFPPNSYMAASFQSKHTLLRHGERIVKGVRKYFGAA